MILSYKHQLISEQRRRWSYTKNKDDRDLCDLKFLSETMLQMHAMGSLSALIYLSLLFSHSVNFSFAVTEWRK